MPATGASYRGRFAPSPTGPLHLGSLIAALASYLDARHNRGTWLVRIDDLDPPREQPGAARSILQSLERHDLCWDEEPIWQSRRSAAYEQALATLADAGITFNCDCPRHSLSPLGCCQASCRARQSQISTPSARRIAVDPERAIAFTDTIQDTGPQRLEPGLDDFVIKRKDGLYAYQLAVAVDDASQGITHIVRGSDLMDSTARQIYLQQVLELPTPIYGHLPVITNAQGQKFSKQNHAPALKDSEAAGNLRQALDFLRQARPPAELVDTASILSFACGRWDLAQVPSVPSIAAGPGPGPV